MDSRDTTTALTGADLEELRKDLGFTVQDACWLFNKTPIAWNKLTADATKPITDQTLVLIYKLLREYPEYSLIPIKPEMNEVIEFLKSKSEEELTLSDMAMLLGKDRTSGSRWKRYPEGVSVSVIHLYYMLRHAMEDGALKFEDWKKIVTHSADEQGKPFVYSRDNPAWLKSKRYSKKNK